MACDALYGFLRGTDLQLHTMLAQRPPLPTVGDPRCLVSLPHFAPNTFPGTLAESQMDPGYYLVLP